MRTGFLLSTVVSLPMCSYFGSSNILSSNILDKLLAKLKHSLSTPLQGNIARIEPEFQSGGGPAQWVRYKLALWFAILECKEQQEHEQLKAHRAKVRAEFDLCKKQMGAENGAFSEPFLQDRLGTSMGKLRERCFLQNKTRTRNAPETACRCVQNVRPTRRCCASSGPSTVARTSRRSSAGTA